MNRDQAKLIVLESTNPPDGTTRYIDQVVSHSREDIEFRYLSPLNLFRRADVFHVHWPEVIVRGRGRLETLLRVGLLRAALALMSARGTAIVRTLHNLEPHESGTSFERHVLQYLDDATTVFVTINPVTSLSGRQVVYIPHGDYRDRFRELPRREMRPGLLLYAGLIRPYKGVERLIEQFPLRKTRDLHLRIVGKPTEELRTAITAAVDAHDDIDARFGFLDDDDFVSEMSQAELVCLPYQELHNSGILLVALSLSKPVLAPRTPTTEALREEVGPGWLQLFDGPFTSDAIDNAFAALRDQPPTSLNPRLDDRTWQLVGSRYADVFANASRQRQQARNKQKSELTK